MKTALPLVLSSALCACGPSYGGQDVKTSDEWLAEQEKLAMEEEKKKKERGDDYTAEETDAEKRKKWDEKQAKLELTRATLSAETCPGVVAEQEDPKNKPRGQVRVSITFGEDGAVKDASIPSPFDETPVGSCVLNAYKVVLVPPFTGGDHIVDWELELKDQEPEGDKGKGKKEKKK